MDLNVWKKFAVIFAPLAGVLVIIMAFISQTQPHGAELMQSNLLGYSHANSTVPIHVSYTDAATGEVYQVSALHHQVDLFLAYLSEHPFGLLVSTVVLLSLAGYIIWQWVHTNTLKKKAEEGLLYRDRCLKYAGDAVIMTDAEGIIKHVNPAFTRLTGYTAKEVIGKTPRVLKSDEHTSDFYEDMWYTIKRGEVWTSEVINKRKDGMPFESMLTIAPVFDTAHELEGFVATQRDITTQKEVETALRESEEQLYEITAGLGEGIFVIDADQHITFVNPEAERMLGWQEAELLGKHAHNMIHYQKEDGSPLLEEDCPIYGSILAGERLQVEEDRFMHRDGTPVPVSYVVNPLLRDGKPAGATIAFHDITNRKKMQEELVQSEERYRKLFEQTPDTVFIHDGQKLLFANPAALKLVGASSMKEALDRPLAEYLRPEDLKNIAGQIETLLRAGGEVPLHEEIWVRMDGSHVTVEVSASSLEYRGKRVLQLTARDVSARKEAEAALQESERRYRHLVEYSPDAVVIHNGEKILFANAACARLVKAISPEEIIGMDVQRFVAPEELEVVGKRTQELLRQGGDALPHEEVLVCLDDSRVTIEIAATALSFQGQRCLQAVARDITERKEMENKLEQLAHYDTLTGLPNRALFFDRLNQTIAKAKRDKHTFALLYLDLDGFKQINDTYGHAIGDKLLKEATARIQTCLRNSDTVARMGGDEFTVILPDVAGDTDVTKIASKIVADIKKPFNIKGYVCHAGISIGIAFYPNDATKNADLIKKADLAMYAVKETGKNNCAAYHAIADKHESPAADMKSKIPVEN